MVDEADATGRADEAHAIKAVMVVQNETATGVTSDVAAVRRAIDAAGHPVLLFVDGVSSIGCVGTARAAESPSETGPWIL